MAVGLLVLTLAPPGAADAAPTPSPTLAPPRPNRGAASPVPPTLSQRPVVVQSPLPEVSPSVASPQPTTTPSATSSPTSTPTPLVQTPTPEPVAGQASDGSSDPETAIEWQAFVPTDTADHLATMDRSARNSGCGVPWQLLAAIARIESDFGRNMSTSSAGAMGYGQFLPSSWQAFGNDGNVYDYRDALPAIAAYLCRSGLATDPRAALFAYNHAEWYVDMVLDLAMRYDRMAPGAPTPAVLDLNPALDQSIPMHYAAGRDVRQQDAARVVDGQTTWLGIPWRGRAAGSAISPSSLENTTLAMVRAAFGLSGELPEAPSAQFSMVAELADRAWAGELFANPRPLGAAWSVAEIRQRVEAGEVIVAFLKETLLPGHPASGVSATGDQPVVIIGLTARGVVYSDPSFSSSLGYGLEMSDADFRNAWQAASTPLQALVFSPRPEPPSRDSWATEARPGPSPTALLIPVATPLSLASTPVPAVVPTPERQPSPVAELPAAEPPPAPVHAEVAGVAVERAVPDYSGDVAWLIILSTALVVGAGCGARLRRATRGGEHD